MTNRREFLEQLGAVVAGGVVANASPAPSVASQMYSESWNSAIALRDVRQGELVSTKDVEFMARAYDSRITYTVWYTG